MLILSVAPLKCRAKAVLDIVHPKMMKDGEVQKEMESITCETRQVVRAGEHFLTDGRFNHFSTIVLHTVSDDLYKDFVYRVTRSDFTRRIKTAIVDPKRTVVILGSAIRCIPEKMTIIPLQSGLFWAGHIKHSAIDVESPGLGLTNLRLDINVEQQLANPKYNQFVTQIHEPVYSFSSAARYLGGGKNHNEIEGGKVYEFYNGEVKEVKTLPITSITERHEAGQVKPIEPIYASQSELHKEEAQANEPFENKGTLKVPTT